MEEIPPRGVAFFHIPKCGGTSLRFSFPEALQCKENNIFYFYAERAHPKAYPPDGSVITKMSGSDGAKWLQTIPKEDVAQCKFTTGHLLCKEIVDQFPNLWAFTILRDPWDWCCSWYGQPDHVHRKYHPAVWKEKMAFIPFIEGQIYDPLVTYLSHTYMQGKAPRLNEKKTQKDLELAREAITNHLDFIIYEKNLLPKVREKAEENGVKLVKWRPRNVNPRWARRKIIFSEEEKEHIIKTHLSLDYKLFNYAGIANVVNAPG